MNSQLFPSRTVEILIVDDCEDEVKLTRIAFKKSNLRHNLHHAKDGEECLAFLRKQGEYAGAPVPDLILLDLNMPRVSGFQVLTEIMADDTLVSIPVIVLSTSTNDQDISKAYKLHCNSYIAKPVDFERFLQMIRVLSEYWFTVVAMPSVGPVEKEKATGHAGLATPVPGAALAGVTSHRV